MTLRLCSPEKYLTIFFFLITFTNVSASEVTISGYSLGGKLEADTALKVIPYDEIVPGWKSYTFQQRGFFELSEVVTDENLTIHGLSFEKRYEINIYNLSVTRDRIKNDLQQLKSAIEEKYGFFDTEEATDILGDKSNRNLFWLSAIEQAMMIKSPPEGIAQIIIFLTAPALDLDKPETERKITLSLIYLDPQMINILKAKKLKRFSDF